jgi:hypothetical protein
MREQSFKQSLKLDEKLVDHNSSKSSDEEEEQ